MKHEHYVNILANQEYDTFDFISVGKNGRIYKRIAFAPLRRHIFSLTFGDVTEEGVIDDRNVSDNGDRDKILATIVRAINVYIGKYPKRWVYLTGSTPARNRLYRMVVNKHFEELSKLFEIFMEVDDTQYSKYQGDGNVTGILIRRNLLYLNYEKET